MSEFETFQENIKVELQQCGATFDFPMPEGFVEWLISKGVFFQDCYKTIDPKIRVENSIAGNCFHNSQLVAIQNEELVYFEGIMRGKTKKGTLHHGVNIFNGCVLDVSYLSNSQDFIEFLNDTDFFYFGVEIPEMYYRTDKRILENKTLDNPLILKFFNDCQNGSK